MRFDDMIATVLAQPADTAARRTAQWQQLVDLLAQSRADPASEGARRGYALLRAERGAIDPAVRRRSARSLTGLAIDPELLAFFAEDNAAVAAPLIAGTRLSDEAWLALVPRLGPAARALLRHRQDVGPAVRRALGLFGPSDFVIDRQPEPAPAAATPPERTESQIRELVERIEAFRRHREEAGPAPMPAMPAEPAEGFRWETGTDGMIIWVEGAPRGPLVGQGIAAIAEPGQPGVDGQAAGAFEKRSPFRDARFSVAGEGPAAGDWRISGVPFFDPARGNFLGYRGTARRPRLDEVARGVSLTGSGVFGSQLPADALRQLIHELRTPLNAILGFAEMIEGQYLGPAALPYRGQASDIMDQAKQLLSAVDDLDTAARIETRRLDLEDSAVDAAALIARLHESYAKVARQRGSELSLVIAPGLPPARVEPGAAERMFSRTLAATIGLAGPGETIALTMAPTQRAKRAMVRLSVDRPQAIAGVAEAALLDPGYSPEGDWPGAPALGLGFALRLVRNLAEAVGGALVIDPDRIALFLPALSETPEAAGQGGSGV
jgi:signal transduction histidine kinase